MLHGMLRRSPIIAGLAALTLGLAGCFFLPYRPSDVPDPYGEFPHGSDPDRDDDHGDDPDHDDDDVWDGSDDD